MRKALEKMWEGSRLFRMHHFHEITKMIVDSMDIKKAHRIS